MVKVVINMCCYFRDLNIRSQMCVEEQIVIISGDNFKEIVCYEKR